MNDSRKMAATCPLCGGDNQCDIAAGKSGENCWCQSATISTEAREKAADSSAEQCICIACGRPTGATGDAG